MSLRMKLVCALVIAALVPMGVAVGVTILRAEKRAQHEADERVAAARRLASVLVERHMMDVAGALGRAADDLAGDQAALAVLLVPVTTPAARAVAPPIAGRFALDHLEILAADGTVLSSFPSDATIGRPSEAAALPEGEIVPRRFHAPGLFARPELGLVGRLPVPATGGKLLVAGGQTLGRGFIETIAEVSGYPVAILDPQGELVASAGSLAEASTRLTADVPIAGTDEPEGHLAASPTEPAGKSEASGSRAWTVRLLVPSADVATVRREMLGTLAGIAPLALASSLFLGFLLAEGISRPIRALTRRAEAISSGRAEIFSLPAVRDEVHRLTLCFDRMLDALSESEQQRVGAERIAAWQEVARRIAHEVKNPLSPIRIAVENLRRTRAKAPSEFERAFQEETATILEEVESLRRLVDEFSQFARLPSPQLAPCDLREVVQQTVALFKPRLDAAGVRVEVSADGAPPRVQADAEQIGRLLKNLVSNALEAMESAAERRLGIALCEEPGPRGPLVRLEVRDTGAGFTPESLRHAFEPYFTTRREKGGSGLGMAIAYRIVSEHGGTILAEGARGHGALITVRLPVAGPSPAAGAA